MTNVHLRRPVLLFVANGVSFAAHAAEISAQPGSTPQRPLSDAISEALQSPLHGEHIQAGPGGQSLPLPVAFPPMTSGSHSGLAASPASRSAGGQVAAADDAPPLAKVFLWTALTAAAGYYFTLYVHDWCESRRAPVRYDSGFPSWQQDDTYCELSSNSILTAGVLGTFPLSVFAANVAGMDFVGSVLGSALGAAGGVLATLLVPDGVWSRAGMGVLTLTHATVATLVAKW